MQGKRIVVTGGAGFIGSHLTCALAEDNEVVVIDDLSTGKIENIQKLVDTNAIKFIKRSVCDRALLQKMFSHVDVVFHLAAVASVPKSVKDPITTHEVNVTGTLNVLLAARDSNAKKVVFSSSCAVYGNPAEEQLPLKETAALQPLSPYAASKLMGEYYCTVFNEIYDLTVVCLRYFNVYGPRQDPHSEYATVIPRFIMNLMADKPLTIFGDGNQTRDFVFIDDVVKTNIFAAKQELKGVFNVGSGKGISINELAESLLRMDNTFGKKVEIIHDSPRPGEVRYSFADISKIKKVGFEPKYTLKQGLRITRDCFSKETIVNF